MSRLIKKTAILLKNETTYGVDAAPTGAANALLVSNLSINPLVTQNVERNNIKPYFGGDEELVGTVNTDFGFDLELVGSGTAGTAPPIGPAILTAGFAETVTAGARVDYTPITDGQQSSTVYWHDSGVNHKHLGARADATFKLNVGERPLVSLKCTALDGGAFAVANPTAALSAFKAPQVVTNANTQDLIFGCTHLTTGAPALTGGTPYPSKGIEFSVGNSVSYDALLGSEAVDITDRKGTGSIRLQLTAEEELIFKGYVEQATLTSIGLVHGTAAGKKVLVFLPSVQLINYSKQESNGKRLIGFDLRLVPVAGNDEMRIVFF